MEGRVLGARSAAAGGVSSRELIAWWASLARDLLPVDFEPAHVGLYVASEDGGVAASVALWQEALTHGPGFANPRLFPQTLASYAPTALAAELDVRGPTMTLVGRAEAALAAVQHALLDLQQGRVERALVGAIRLAEPAATAFLLLAPNRVPPGATLRWTPAVDAGENASGLGAVELLRTAADGVQTKQPIHLCHAAEGSLQFRPAPT